MGGSAFQIRGVIEGFYGTFYTFPQRNDLIRFAGESGFNFYVYGPKNDRQHRMRWWDPYPPIILDEFAETIRIARDAGVQFCYAVSFGVPLDYSSAEDFEVVTTKLRTFFDRGCRAFGVMLDDLVIGFAYEVSRRRFRSIGEAHGDLCNRLLTWLRSQDDSCTLCLCPGEYHGRAPFGQYLHDLGGALDPAVDVFYTGPHVCSRTISVCDVSDFAAVIRRQPLLWDNYPANDLLMRSELHVGPLTGRDPQLPTLTRGLVANLMNQPEASKIALQTIADYLRDPESYDPKKSWKRALLRAGGEDAFEPLTRFAENSLGSALQDEEAPILTSLLAGVLALLERGEPLAESEAEAALSRYLTVLDESIYFLRNRMRNLALRQDLMPWIEALDEKLWLGRHALACLRAVEEGGDVQKSLGTLEELLGEVERNSKRIGGTKVVELAQLARERAVAQAGLASTPAEGGQATVAEMDAGAITAPSPPDDHPDEGAA